MRHKVSIAVLTLLVFLAFSSYAITETQLDQSFDPGDPGISPTDRIVGAAVCEDSLYVRPGVLWAQTFTAGVYGMLVALELKVYHCFPDIPEGEQLRVDIVDVDYNGNPNPQAILATGMFDSSSLPPFTQPVTTKIVRLDLDHGVPLTAGMTYGMIARGPSQGCYCWILNQDGGYDLGDAFLWDFGQWIQSGDLGFSNYVTSFSTFEEMVDNSVTIFFGDQWIPFLSENLLSNYPESTVDSSAIDACGKSPITFSSILENGIGASFTPNFGHSLDEAASIGGYHHFNWLQYIEYIDEGPPGDFTCTDGFDNDEDLFTDLDDPDCVICKLECKSQEHCKVDPNPTGKYESLACAYGRWDEDGELLQVRDRLPFYLDEEFTNDGLRKYSEGGGDPEPGAELFQTKLEAWTLENENTLLFSDAPNVRARFRTCLVGVSNSGYEIIDAPGSCFCWFKSDDEFPVPQTIDTPIVHEDFGVGVGPERPGIISFGGFIEPGNFTAGEIKLLADHGVGIRDIRVVSIDLEPMRKQNIVNLRWGWWYIPVAILTTPDFDATDVDESSVKFGPDEATKKFRWVRDVDRDGDTDNLFIFKIGETGIECGQTEALLSGKTFDGGLFIGIDAIKTIGCKKKH